VSIGIAYHSKNLDTGEKLIKAADVALYKAKNSGRNTIKTYNKGIGDDR
jgi:PleD family two-component response regulator